MQISNQYLGWILVCTALGFALIVIGLHVVQSDYDPVNQQMSELALGRLGYAGLENI